MEYRIKSTVSYCRLSWLKLVYSRSKERGKCSGSKREWTRAADWNELSLPYIHSCWLAHYFYLRKKGDTINLNHYAEQIITSWKRNKAHCTMDFEQFYISDSFNYLFFSSVHLFKHSFRCWNESRKESIEYV